MSDNIEMVQGAYEAFGRGDIPALMANFADDIEWHSPEPLPQHIDARGPENVGQFFQRVADNWSDFQVDLDDIVASGDRVCPIGHAAGKLDATAAEYVVASVPAFAGAILAIVLIRGRDFTEEGETAAEVLPAAG